MFHPLVVGVDLSLTSCGIARWNPSALWLGTIVADPKVTGLMRLRQLRTRVIANCRGADLIVLEALPPANRIAKSAGLNERAGLYFMVLDRLHELGLRYAEVQPTQLKGYALGKGAGADTGKTAVTVAVVKRYHAEPRNDDEADACVLAAMGRHFLGMPPAPVPELHKKWLTAVRWPEGRRFREFEDGDEDAYARERRA
jgi:Holliday junction resolvasome RuvABC endonuclease subunit